MEVSLLGNSQVNIVRIDLGNRESRLCKFSRNLSFTQLNSFKNSKICTGSKISRIRSAPLLLKASSCAQTEAVVSSSTKFKACTSPKLYVGLPLDAVSINNSIKHARAIEAGLKALKLLGVEGVELPIWWGIVEKEAMGKYNWTGYLALAELVRKTGLKLHLSLYFHASNQPHIPLPDWVSKIGESQPDIYFTDRSGQRCKDCLSLSADDLPILDGKTPLEVYKNFFDNFTTSFARFLGSSITGVSIGLGPNGELRYPSYQNQPKHDHHHNGAGEFQCYDKNMLSHLEQHAKAHGQPLWGLSGPHDSPKYDETPISNGFFKENGGSWESAYGDFFLSWYSNQLVSHGDRLLSLATSTLSDYPVSVYGQIPLVSAYYRTRCHPSEVTAGYYNTASRNGYDPVMEMFSRKSCKIILPGMDLSDPNENESLSSPESLLQHITSSCRKHGVEISGMNSIASGTSEGFKKIKTNLLGNDAPRLFIYQRMGAYFFSPEHFPKFTQFVRNLRQPETHPDDLPIVQKADSDESCSGETLHTQSYIG